MTALISGSLAFDTNMVFQDRFANHILPEQVHILNVAFLVPELRRDFGGCAGNIAYSLRLLGGTGIPLATVGADFDDYAARLQGLGIPMEHIEVLGDHYTAQAYITSDLDDNQITAFHPGAMNQAHRLDVPTGYADAIGIVAPNGREAMLKHARQFRVAGIPFVFDPGQGLPMFDGEELLQVIDEATWLAANDYESLVIQQRTGLGLAALAERVAALVVTRGAEGSQIYTNGECLDIPAAPPEAVVNPTGCGDAYRAGMLYGLERGWDWLTVGRLASLMGATKIAHAAPQGFQPSLDTLRAAYARAFGAPAPL